MFTCNHSLARMDCFAFQCSLFVGKSFEARVASIGVAFFVHPPNVSVENVGLIEDLTTVNWERKKKEH
jgi:hypothetical protein